MNTWPFSNFDPYSTIQYPLNSVKYLWDSFLYHAKTRLSIMQCVTTVTWYDDNSYSSPLPLPRLFNRSILKGVCLERDETHV